MVKKEKGLERQASAGEDCEQPSPASPPAIKKQRSKIKKSSSQRLKEQPHLSALHHLEEGVPLVKKDGIDNDKTYLPRPPQLTRSGGASARQISSSSRPGAFAVNSLYREGRSRSDGDFSMSGLTVLTDHQQETAALNHAATPTASTTSQTAPTLPISPATSDLQIADAPIIAMLVGDLGSQGESIPEAIRTSSWSDKRVRFVIGVLVVMVLGAVGAVVGLLLFTDSSSGDGSSSSTETNEIDDEKPPKVLPTDGMPSAAPSQSPTRIGQDMLDILVEYGSFDNGAALLSRNSSTPQKLASQWMLNDVNVITYSRSRLLQRYVLATLYYSAVLDNDESSFTSSPLLVTDHECFDYAHVQCNNAGHVVAIEHAWTSTTRGTLPDELGLLSTDLQLLDLGNNQLQGTLPTTLGLLAELTALRLRYNHFSGTIPSELGELTKLRDGFGLEGNSLTGSIPSSLGQLSILQWMGLHSNFLVGPMPPELWSMTALRTFLVNNNKLTGTIAIAIGQLSNLKDIALGRNQFVGTLPTELAELVSLQSLHLGDNELTGTLPSKVFEVLSNLEYLNLGHNKFEGSLPTQLSLLTSLSDGLLLNNNLLTSTIPTELGRLRLLELDFDLSNNMLSGMIPTELGWLTNLEQMLSLAGNRLEGTIPSELGNVTLLSTLSLEDNVGLIGTLPTSLGFLRKLVALIVYGSGLTGSVPDDICFLRDVQLTTLKLNCDVLCTCCNDFCY